MKYEAIIFDLDGVLVFTDQYHFLAWKKIADELGIFFDQNMNNALRGVSRAESLEIILQNSSLQLTAEEKARVLREKNAYYKELLTELEPSAVKENVRNMLTVLKQKGLKLAVGSSSKNTKYILQKTDLAKYFDAVSDGTNITCSKPDPEVFLKAAEMLHVPPENCMVVEDAEAGIDAAKAGCMYAIGIGTAAKYDKTDYGIADLIELQNHKLLYK
ncbi:MAG: beta-phosphoglucomutase [Lachnospiraceae bacterium]|nr:beta-phosphoglucomutase [Lachnospiraceae bacterium]